MLKIFSIFLYTLSLRLMGTVVVASNFINLDWHYLFFLFVTIMFIPEIGFIISSSFRRWLKDGIEDSDGKFNKSDFASLLIHYSTLWCIRLFVLFGLLEAFYGIQVREMYVLGSLAGAFGVETVGYFTRNKVKKDDSGTTNS